jgi:hypothetical protein
MQQASEVQRLKTTAEERARAVQSALERINPQREPKFHAHLFEAYLFLLRHAMQERGQL